MSCEVPRFPVGIPGICTSTLALWSQVPKAFDHRLGTRELASGNVPLMPGLDIESTYYLGLKFVLQDYVIVIVDTTISYTLHSAVSDSPLG